MFEVKYQPSVLWGPIPFQTKGCGAPRDDEPKDMLYTMSSNAADAEDVYTGNDVPRDVVHVRVDLSVTSIPCICGRKKLAEVELCECLVEIGAESFYNCHSSIMTINIPYSLRRIYDYAFH